MAVQMVDINNRNAQSQRQTFGETCAYEQRSDKTGAARECYGREVVFGEASAFYRRVDHGNYVLLVRAGCKLRDYASVFFMYCLRGYDIAAENPVAYYGGGGVVAR